jgi:hypothetical protein
MNIRALAINTALIIGCVSLPMPVSAEDEVGGHVDETLI